MSGSIEHLGRDRRTCLNKMNESTDVPSGSHRVKIMKKTKIFSMQYMWERKKEALEDGINTYWNVEVHSTWVRAAAKTKDQEVDCAGCG